MSMLAERKRKTKWIINPTKKPLWTTDSNGIKFGKELMEKMGWSAGKGLGVYEQGIQEPLKVSYKNDTKGMGFKGNDDEWIEYQDEFNLLLDKLRNDSCLSKTSESEKNEIQSLEEKSKRSRARVHYQKFTRGKDLSRYSENDLACILGTNKLNKKKKAQNEENICTNLNNNSTFETSFGVTTINSGTIQNYFKKKCIFDKKPTEKLSTIDGNFVESPPSGKFNFSESFESKADKKISNGQHELQSEVNILEINKGEASESEKCKKKKRSIAQSEPAEKKRKENTHGCILKNKTVNDINNHLDENNEDESMRNENLKFNLVKKKKKNKNDEILEVEKKKRKTCFENSENFHEEYLNDELCDTNQGKIKENEDIKNNGSCNIQCEPLDKCISEQVSYKKKKKFKKEKLEDNEEIRDTNFSNDQNGELIELNFSMKSSEDKKEKEKSKELKKSKKKRFSGCSDPLSNNENCEVGELELEVELSEKKHADYKKGMSEDNDKIKEFSSNLKILSNNQNNEAIELVCEAKSSNKKKEERKKSEHDEQIRDTKLYSNNQIGEVIELCSIIKSNKGKKKKEKEKKLKDYEVMEDKEYCSFPNTFSNDENSVELESAVRKKKKSKREKLVRNKDISDENYYSNKAVRSNDCNIAEKINCSSEENVFNSGNKKVKSNHDDFVKEVYTMEGFAEKKSSSELTDILEVSSSKKKKKDQQEELKDALNRENIIEEPVEKEDEIQMPHAKKSSKGRRLTNSHNLRNDESAESGVHQHKLEFLNEKRADKFYPGQYTNDRVQRLLCWVNFSEFKGSNLENVTGYGRLLKCKNKPR